MHQSSAFEVDTGGLYSSKITADLKAPSGRTTPCRVTETARGRYKVDVVVTEAGTNYLDVKYGDRHITGSPFAIKAADPSLIRVDLVDRMKKLVGDPVVFNVDAAQAGSGSLEIMVNGGHVNCDVTETGKQTFRGKFIPEKPITHTVEMRFNDQPVPGSPWQILVEEEDISRIRAYGEGLTNVRMHQSSAFEVDTGGLYSSKITANLRAPSGQTFPCRVDETGHGQFKVNFVVTETGTHYLDVKYGERHIKGSPFTIRASNPALIKVELPDKLTGFVGTPIYFNVDASKAGSGNLEIMVNGGHVFCDVQNLGNQRFRASFTPSESGLHNLEMKFNDEALRGSPWPFNIVDPSKIKVYGDGLRNVGVNRMTSFEIDSQGADIDELDAHLLSPSGERVPIKLVETPQKNVYRADYVASSPGLYTIETKYSGAHVGGGPFTVKTTDPGAVLVDMPQGPVCKGIPVTFTVDASQAGSGSLEIMVNGGHVNCSVENLGSQRFKGTFIPETVSRHTVEMSFNKETVRGSPWQFDVVDLNRIRMYGEGLKGSTINKPAWFEIDTGGQPGNLLEVKLTDPEGRVLPTRVTETQNNVYRVEYALTEMGKHTMEVKYAGHNVGNSPYRIKATDPKRIIVHGLPDSSISFVGVPISFIVDANKAGSGNLEIMVNKGKVQVDVVNQGMQTFKASYTPREPKPHMLELNFNNEPVPGFPRTFEILDPASMMLYGEALQGGHIHRNYHAELSTGSVDVIPVANLTASSGKITPCRVVPGATPGTHKVEYILAEKGTNTLEVKVAGQHVGGSPYVMRAYDPASVRLLNLPTQATLVGKPVQFIVDASDAGSGNLEIMVNNGMVHCDVSKLGNQKYQVSFVPSEAKAHVVELTFNKMGVQGSPWTHEVVDAGRVTLHGEGLQAIRVSKMATFDVHTEGAGPGEVIVKVKAPSGRMVPCRIVPTTRDTYTVEYMATEVGPHHLTVSYGGKDVSGSPFVVKAYDPTKILVGPVPNAVLGQPITFNVDVGKAGQGQLEIAINSGQVPNTVKVMPGGICQVTFVPRELSTHHIDIKFNKVLVPGCPYKCLVSDLSQLSVVGAGIGERVMVDRQATFSVSGVTQGEKPHVVITAPSGYNVNTHAYHTDNKTYTVEYTPKEAGMYKVNVEYPAGRHITGSPFNVKSFDPSQVTVSEIKRGRVGQTTEFTVDASRAGEGSLDISVEARGRVLPCQVFPRANAVFAITFQPVDAVPHYVTVSFNREPVPGSPFLGVITDESGQLRREHDVNAATSAVESSQLVKSTPNQENLQPSQVANVAGSTSQNKTSYKKTTSSTKVVKSSTSRMTDSQGKTEMSGYAEESQSSSRKEGDRPALKDESRYTVTKSAVDTPEYADSKTKMTYKTMDEPEKVEKHRTTVTKSHDGPDSIHTEIFKTDGRGQPSIERETSFRSSGGVERATSSASSTARAHDASKDYTVPLYVSTSDRQQQQATSRSHQSSHSEQVPYYVETQSTLPAREPHERSGHSDSWSKVDYSSSDARRAAPTQSKSEESFSKSEEPNYEKSQEGPKRVTKSTRVVKEMRKKEVKSTTRTSHSGSREVDRRDTGGGPLYVTDTSHSYERREQPFREPLADEAERAYYATESGRENSSHAESSSTSKVFTTKELNKVRMDGRGITAATLNQPSHFMIDSRGQGEPTVVIKAPNGDTIQVSIRDRGNGIYRVEYTATMLGDHKAMILFHGMEIPNCPYVIKVYHVSNVKVKDMPVGTVGVPATFMVDASEAGSGNLEVTVNDGDLPASAEYIGGNRYAVYFTPAEAKPHKIQLNFNGEIVPGSPFTVRVEKGTGAVVDVSRVYVHGDAFGKVPVNRAVGFTVEPRDAGPADCSVIITSPSKQAVPHHTSRPTAGKIHVEFTPREVGEHAVVVRYGGHIVPGSPFVCKAYDVQMVKVSDVGYATVGQQSFFHIDASRAGTGNLEIVISCADVKIPNYVQNEGNARFRVSFKPVERKPHSVNVRFNGVPVPGSPFRCDVIDSSGITAMGDGLRRTPVGKSAMFIIDPLGLAIADIQMYCQSPSGQKVPLEVSGTAKLKVEYTPLEVGIHTLSIMHAGRDIVGSPFRCNVYDSSRVKVSRIGPGTVGVPVKFHVDSTEAGEGLLSVDISCKGRKVESFVRQMGEGMYDVEFTPKDSAPHMVEITWNNEVVGDLKSGKSRTCLDPRVICKGCCEGQSSFGIMHAHFH
ncbi:PREDICTED: filamin-A-like [Priapulus caudatus]|uniref:Filamin-A-like n=1 Tax=Priapulus caudatus TaxID=37621 RepID=A0ABM1E9P5_PRICU|nr:PREDICTED: filamin-A-like [Priapulus caudatus]